VWLSHKHGTVFLSTSLHQLLYRLSRDNLKHFYLPNLSHHFKFLFSYLYRVLEATSPSLCHVNQYVRLLSLPVPFPHPLLSLCSPLPFLPSHSTNQYSGATVWLGKRVKTRCSKELVGERKEGEANGKEDKWEASLRFLLRLFHNCLDMQQLAVQQVLFQLCCECLSYIFAFSLFRFNGSRCVSICIEIHCDYIALVC